MEGAAHPEKDSGIFGGLFQTVINDLRGSSPIWEDFTYKSLKLHGSLKTAVVAIGAFLEAFQKVADMATSSKGATREIGSALTRLCMRHRSIESHLKVLTSSILDNLVAPLQEKLEDWKKSVAQLDKDHAKEYKKAKQEIKKAASDTMRLQKKVRKGSTHGKSDMQHKLDTAMMDVNSKYHQLEEAEKNSVRSALIEERSRFCLFITCLKPFVDQELKLLTEMSHIHEIMESLCLQASEPSSLPASSEQVILDLKGVDSTSFNFSQQPSPPSSPSSLGSRKSSMCSINSINSSSSGSSKSHSPSHTMHKRTASQPPPGAIRLTSVSSQDSGFTSQDTLFLRPNTPQSLSLYQASVPTEREGEGDCDSTPTTPSDNTPSASSTWNNWPNLPGAPRTDPARPHTISSAYEKGHNRPALKPDMFEPPQEGVEMRPKLAHSMSHNNSSNNRPSATISKLQPVLPPHCPKPKVKAVAPPTLPPGAQPIYANMADLANRGGSQSDMSPDDGEPTTPTTPASVSITQGETSSIASLSSSTSQPVSRMTALDEALEQMGVYTASISSEHEPASDTSEEVTPRSSVDEPSASDVNSTGGQATFAGGEEVAEHPRVKIQQNTSLELAKAIRELEASTAALTSAYDTEPPYTVINNNHAAPTSAAAATYDTDSYTSKTSLQCSSGYGTMNSTPAGSEDTIPSGGLPENIAEEEEGEGEEERGEGGEGGGGGECEYEELEALDGEDCSVLGEDDFESEKYFTIPRSGEAHSAYIAALHAKRPASTAGIPVSGASVARRSSVNSQKPPPPVRRTASVTGVPPPHVQKMRTSPPKQMSADGVDSAYGYGGGEGMVEGPYAELQLIQQSIHGRGNGEGSVTPTKSGQYQHQLSGGEYPMPPGGTHTAGIAGGHYMQAPPQGPVATANVIQSLNAKFASLNSQYQDENGHNVVDGGGGGADPRGHAQKPAPPAVMQKPSKPAVPPPTYVMGGHRAGQPPQHSHNPPHKGHQHHGPKHHSHQHQQHHQQHQQHLARQPHPSHQHRPNPHQQHSHYSDTHAYQQQQLQLQQQQQQQRHPAVAAPGDEDFPLPPTQEELQEMERIYSRPPPSGPAIKAPVPHPQQKRQTQPPASGQVRHPQQQQPAQQQQQPQDVQASLLMELKRRVSVDDSSNA